MKRFCNCSLWSHLNVLTLFPLTGGCSEGLDAFRLFFKQYVFQYREERNFAYVQRARQKMFWLHSHEPARQKTRAGCYCAPPTVIPTYLGSRHLHSTETARSFRSQPAGEGGKGTAAFRPTTTDEWPPFAPGSSVSDRRPPQGVSSKRQQCWWCGDCLYDSHTADSRTGCAAASAQGAGAGMEGRRPGRSRDQHGDGRETSSLEVAEGWHPGQSADEGCPARIYAITGSVTMPTKCSLKDTSRVWRRICASVIRGGSTSAASPWT